MDFIKSTPENVDELVKKAGDKTSGKRRLEAVQELGRYDCQQTRDVIKRIALHDRVRVVQETAFRIAQGLGIKKNGKPIFLGKKDIGYKSSDFTKVFQRVKRESEMEYFDLETFKEKFKKMNPEMFDVMTYDKGSKFDRWIENIFNSLPKNK
ncbi:HEAT repeat domain-containing protein [Evansella tamaricis]|uniref:HEAT repeat domain-containing protein n=1 Tax=Evansella tamaricis TaxID=2069301 RepID=A0ABS6JBM0_9BACI|nr:HEAT repeat domain-containing protein [Evansella tamaricis]MBU9711076.1 HEAT repeat domain-containing protein [Evansella tamaricis]